MTLHDLAYSNLRDLKGNSFLYHKHENKLWVVTCFSPDAVKVSNRNKVIALGGGTSLQYILDGASQGSFSLLGLSKCHFWFLKCYSITFPLPHFYLIVIFTYMHQNLTPTSLLTSLILPRNLLWITHLTLSNILHIWLT